MLKLSIFLAVLLLVPCAYAQEKNCSDAITHELAHFGMGKFMSPEHGVSKVEQQGAIKFFRAGDKGQDKIWTWMDGPNVEVQKFAAGYGQDIIIKAPSLSNNTGQAKTVHLNTNCEVEAIYFSDGLISTQVTGEICAKKA